MTGEPPKPLQGKEEKRNEREHHRYFPWSGHCHPFGPTLESHTLLLRHNIDDHDHLKPPSTCMIGAAVLAKTAIIPPSTDRHLHIFGKAHQHEPNQPDLNFGSCFNQVYIPIIRRDLRFLRNCFSFTGQLSIHDRVLVPS